MASDSSEAILSCQENVFSATHCSSMFVWVGSHRLDRFHVDFVSKSVPVPFVAVGDPRH